MSEDRSKRLESAKDLTVYKLGHELAMKIFRDNEAIPIGRKICANESDSTLVEVDLPELTRSMGEAPV